MTTHLDPALFEAAEGRSRRTMLEHAATCASCRAALFERDPALLFALLALSPVPAPTLAEVSRNVSHRASGDRGGIAEAAGSSGVARRAAAAVVVFAALATGLTTVLLPSSSSPPLSPAPALAAGRADVDVRSAGSASDVVDFTVGETQVVMVYNRNLRL